MATPSDAEPERTLPLRFGATAREYFRIWIANVLLTVLTLGIYSPWAKVRTKRYFYGHTTLDGAPFRYLGKPGEILRGRLILVAAFLAPMGFAIATGNGPMQWAMLAAAAIAAPWVLRHSLAYNAANRELRGIRFRFDGTLTDCAVLFWGWGVIALCTLGLAYPVFKAKLLEYVARNHRYGDARFECGDLGPPLAGAYLGAVALASALLLAITLPLVLLVRAIGIAHLDPRDAPIVLRLVDAAAWVFILGFTKARVANVLWNRLGAGGIRFRSRANPWRLGTIFLTNVVAIVVTLGLATPWAVVRTYRYRMSQLALHGAWAFEATERPVRHPGAGGAEALDILALDFGL